MSKNLGADLVGNALLGKESKTVIVGGKPYFIKPPTIRKIAGAGVALGDFASSEGSFGDILKAMQDTEKAARALSWFIQGDESLTEQLMEGTLEQVVDGLAVAVSMLGIEDFQKLSGLSRSVRRLIANPKS